MARLIDHDSYVEVVLGTWETIGALHHGFAIPRACIISDEVVPDGWLQLRGMRAPGTGFPKVIMLGTTRYDGVKDFCAVYGSKPARVITCQGFEFARVLITLEG